LAEKPAERGGYLVNTIMACGNCHTPRDADGSAIAEKAFSGGLTFTTPAFIATNPEARETYPKGALYDAVEAAELDEPGAMTALIELKLSRNAQFQDRPGACKLIETAVSRGDQTMAPRLSECRAN
jgi:hypothetical protein